MTKTTTIRSQTHKTPLKTHIEALEIQNFLGGGPQTPLTRAGIIPPLVPSALEGFLRRTTFKYAATALSIEPDQLASLVNGVDPDQLASEEAS